MKGALNIEEDCYSTHKYVLYREVRRDDLTSIPPTYNLQSQHFGAEYICTHTCNFAFFRGVLQTSPRELVKDKHCCTAHAWRCKCHWMQMSKFCLKCMSFQRIVFSLSSEMPAARTGSLSVLQQETLASMPELGSLMASPKRKKSPSPMLGLDLKGDGLRRWCCLICFQGGWLCRTGST